MRLFLSPLRRLRGTECRLGDAQRIFDPASDTLPEFVGVVPRSALRFLSANNARSFHIELIKRKLHPLYHDLSHLVCGS